MITATKDNHEKLPSVCDQSFSSLVLILASATPPLFAQDLSVYMTASSEVVGPGDRTIYAVTASNTGSVDLLDVEAEIRLPEHIERLAQTPQGFTCSGGCDGNELHAWNYTRGPWDRFPRERAGRSSMAY